MSNWKSYFHQPKRIEELLKTALVVVDTNVLLSAYQWREVTVKEMVKTLRILSDGGRLRIPTQVVKEFSKNRPGEITQRINDIETLISGLQEHKPLNKKVPILEGKKTYKKADKFQQEYNKSLKEYRKSLIELRDDLKNLFYDDPYLKGIEKILDKSYFISSDNKTEEELVKIAEDRFKKKMPPGYKDSNKEENNAGDYIIWNTILQLNSDVIFVSGDKKIDWVNTDKQGNAISARRELIQEFYNETGGKDFVHISPKEFITLINPSVSKEVKEDLTSIAITYNKKSKENKMIARKSIYIYKKLISDILLKYDPMGIIYDIAEQKDEYDSEADMIFNKLYKCKNKMEVSDLIEVVFKNMFEGVNMVISKNNFELMISEIIEVKEIKSLNEQTF